MGVVGILGDGGGVAGGGAGYCPFLGQLLLGVMANCEAAVAEVEGDVLSDYFAELVVVFGA